MRNRILQCDDATTAGAWLSSGGRRAPRQAREARGSFLPASPSFSKRTASSGCGMFRPFDRLRQVDYRYAMRNDAATPAAAPVLEKFRLDDRVAVVTGGSSTLGRAIGAALSQAGATVVLASRDEERCRAAAAEIDGADG